MQQTRKLHVILVAVIAIGLLGVMFWPTRVIAPAPVPAPAFETIQIPEPPPVPGEPPN
jgi:hypothetical protein